MKIKKILVPSILIWLSKTVILWLTCGWLFSWVYEIPPNIWIEPEIMMNTSNMIYSNLFSFIGTVIFTMVFIRIYNGIPGKGIKKGINYGILVWLVGAFSAMITMPFYMTIASTVIIYWIIQAFVINVIGGYILGALIKK
ncbi:MAG: hypothetical protein GF335_01015 [Candidatus Moranbacteria bacterium]|nr:hypothetical protein [Candidatus Moranbacteria bacterium]